jgi:Family of unknown function (DUF6049)
VSKTLLAAAALTLLPLAVPATPLAAASPRTGGTESAPPAGNVALNGSAQPMTAAHGPRRSDEPETGIAVDLEQIAPAYLQPGDELTVSGTVTNLDRERWRDVQVYLMRPVTAATTPDEVETLADTPVEVADGERILREGFYLELGGLDPGASEQFELSIPFRLLNLSPEAYGVYTLAVQVLATDALDNRDSVAEGRARSLIPLMPDDSPRVGVSTIWPFRDDLVREPDGQYADRDELIEDISSGGRLRTLLDLARTSRSSSTPISLLLDPALLDALRSIVAGDPGRPREPATPSESPSATDEATFDALQPVTPEQRAANDFLDDLAALIGLNSVWIEGYGGPDLTALSDYDSKRLHRTISRANRAALSEVGISSDRSRAYLPTGVLDVEALEALGPKTTTLVTSAQVRRWAPEDGPIATVRSDGSRARVVVANDAVLDGGLEPGPTDTALHVRQRLLAESAVLSLQAEAEGRRRAPAMVMLADDGWDPGANARASDFFDAFDVPWVYATDLSAERTDGPHRGARHLRPRNDAEGREDPPIPTSLARSADRIRGRGVITYAITRKDRQLLSYYDEAAALTVSEQWRADPDLSQEMADETIGQLDGQLAGVTLEAPEFVTLSSSSGQFPLTISNDLAWPITVGVRLEAEDGGLVVEQDEPVDVDPHQSTTVNVRVDAEDVAVSEVTARLTTPKGRPFGEPVTFRVRSSVVGMVIWIALGAAGAIVVFAVGRRVRRSAKSRGEAEPAVPAPGETG